MAALESAFLTCTIDVLEERGISITNIPGGCFITEKDEQLAVFLCGTLAELLPLIDPVVYCMNAVIDSNGKPIL